MAQQLSFDLPARPALERDDFFVSPANALAVALLDTPTSWSNGRLLIIGPEASGKTHLAHVWAAQSQAQIIEARDLTEDDVPRLTQDPVAVENADRIAGTRAIETALFHLLNLAAAQRQPLLITARSAPARWPLSLPDLASRLEAMQSARLEAPDDALLSALLMKLFADRQLNPAPDVIPYLARRMDRSFSAAQDLVGAIDSEALAQKRPITRAFVAAVLDKGHQTPS